jgi:hypothetical protein
MYEEALMLESSRDNNSNGDTEPGVWDVLNAVVEAVEVHALVGDNSALCIAEGASCEAEPDLSRLGSQVVPCRNDKLL